MLVLISGCAILIPKEVGTGETIGWDDLPGWQEDSHAEAWPALLSQCLKLRTREPDWEAICSEADQLSDPSNLEVRTFFQDHFQPHEVIGTGVKPEGLVTGCYEPKLYGSLQANERFSYPLYGRPNSHLILDLDALFPELKSRKVRGRLVGNRVVPFFDREAIMASNIR